MTFEEELINKSYYKTFMGGHENIHPVHVLGEMYMAEKQKEVTELSEIRFAQGEVYFLNKDFEAAIFKWENSFGELEPWAQKNIADAHFELDLLEIAEDYYKAVETDSVVLKTEVLMQLFYLYKRLGKLNQALDTIKKAVNTYPDYASVTDIAKAFYEEHEDASNAVDLAINEAIRTESLTWYSTLESYVERGYTAYMQPSYFREILISLFHLDRARFESLAVAMWNSYRQSDLYFSWLREFNHFILNLEPGNYHRWQKLSILYKETYTELISGDYLIGEISNLMPNLLANWMKFATATDIQLSSSAALAWNDIFPSTMESSYVNNAENLILEATDFKHGLEDGINLFKSIRMWAENNDVLLSQRMEFIAGKVRDLNHYHLLLTGTEANEQNSYLSASLDEELVEESSSLPTIFEHANETVALAITDEGATRLDVNVYNHSETATGTLLINKKQRSFLNENGITLINYPSHLNQLKGNDLSYLSLADSALFVVHVDTPLTVKDIEAAIKLKEQAPELAIHFLLSRVNRKGDNLETDIVKYAESTIHTYFPNAKVFTYYENGNKNQDLAVYIRSIKNDQDLEVGRTKKIQYYIKEAIKYLLKKRMEIERTLVDTIQWHEEMVAKFTGTLHQLSDMEEENIRIMKESYHEIKDTMRNDLVEEIPRILQSCADIITEKSNFGKIHVELNNEMNKRINNYMEEQLLPAFRKQFREWANQGEAYFNETQKNLDEISLSFNQIYGEEKIQLNCDFKILDDWRRDANRMTRGGLPMEDANILKRSTSSHILLNGAGKLFGAIPQSKGMLHTKYKQFIENKDYRDTAEAITNKFMQQFDIFDRSLEGDIKMFFSNPFEVLNKTVEATNTLIKENNDALAVMRKNPENYQDPLTLYSLKLRQQEIMTSSAEVIYN